MRVGFLHSLIRKEEKLLIHEFNQHEDVELVMMDDRHLVFDLENKPDVDVVLERCINHSRALHGLKLLESTGIRCVNTAEVANTCGDKILTALALREHGRERAQRRAQNTLALAAHVVLHSELVARGRPAVGSLTQGR